MRLKESFCSFLRECRQRRFGWLVLFALLAIYFFTLFYGDLSITTEDTFAFLDTVADGSVFSFYSRPCAYPVPIYLIFGIWDLPMWLLSKVGLTTWDSALSFLWAKTLLVLALMGCTWFLRDLLRKSRCEHINFWTFLFLSSFLTVLPVFATAQYDILELFFAMWAIDRAADEEALSWKTLLLCAISISVKLLMAFPLVFLILLKEKRVLYILRDGLALISVTVLTMLPFFFVNSAGSSSTTSFASGILERLISPSLNAGLNDISLYATVFFAACVIAYALRPAEDGGADLLRKLTWLSCMHFFAFFLFGIRMHPFWAILMSPFVALLLAQNAGRVKLNLLLGFVSELCLLFLQVFIYPNVFLNFKSFSYLVLKNIPSLDLTEAKSFHGLMLYLDLPRIFPAVSALLFVCWGALLALNYPWNGRHYLDPAEPETLAVTQRGACTVRLVLLAGYFAVSLLFGFVF